RSFASEVTRVAREVGTEGKLGGQARVEGVSGTWKDLTDNVNFMAGNLTSQVRGIAKVVTSVAGGDLTKKLTVKAKGEIAALADTINGMIDTLALFADQVTTVAREVGVEGKLGGQASVPGAAGTWKDLTDNVNQLAANLTTQVRAIAEVATAVTKGDLTRSIKVEALGEVAALKDNINEMIRNLKDTTLKNSEQDWLKTNLAKFSRMLQGQRDLLTVGRLILSELAPVVSAQHAVFYTVESTTEPATLKLLASYAYEHPDATGQRLALGQGLIGQCALEKQKIVMTNVPPGYVRISSGLGNASPVNLIVLPVVFEGEVKAVLELASFDVFNSTHQAFLEQLMESIGIVLNTIEANMRTQDLLEQSQSLAKELQSRQLELQRTNEELQQRGHMLAYQNAEVERKNREVEQARQALQERAQQLALTSKYKSEFLANMSHELRTPLNSLLILSDQLSKNLDGNLTPKQTEYCQTIHSSGNDLLMLINDILDLSKIESGTVIVDVGELRFLDLHDYLERTFRHVAESKSLNFSIYLDRNLPPAIYTDAKRLQQVVKNLLSNAFKFTHDGEVRLSISTVDNKSFESESLQNASTVFAISVSDTGIGIPPDKQRIIFEAFQQADGSTSRKYGGTGLGLAISREIASLLGGEIRLKSQPSVGSTFTLYLPQDYVPVKPARKPGPTLSEMEAAIAEIEADEKIVTVEADEMDVLEVIDDRDSIALGGRVLLIVDNDLNFAQFLLEAAQSRGFKGLITASGAKAIALAREYQPHAITLDISLPDIDGWRVLDRLKHDPLTRHIPVTVISTEDQLDRSVKLGALGFLGKPIRTQEMLTETLDELRDFVDRPTRQLVLVHRDATRRAELAELIENEEVSVAAFGSRQEALRFMEDREVDCVVLEDGSSKISLGEF
ncbi:MAG: ATP-binding protein, partial [Aureliella sp.]